MAKFANFLLGVLAGALASGVIVTLLAPSSGNELRSQAKDYVKNVQDEVKRARSTRREEMEKQLNELRKQGA
jgi:gas vesicle protein